MKDTLKWIGGGMAAIVVALGCVLGLGYVLGVDMQSHEAATSEPTAPLPTVLDGDALTRTVTTPEVAPAIVREPEPSPFEPVLEQRGAIRARRLIIATGVSAHEPTGETDTIEAGTRVYAFLDAVNETDEQVQLLVTFEPERGEPVGHVGVNVPASASRWRTWAYSRNVSRPGRWEAVVRTPGGQVVARRAFDVVE